MNLRPLLSRLKILDKSIRMVPLELNYVQSQTLDVIHDQLNSPNGRVRLIVLKARQMGISTLTEALLFTMCFMCDHYRGLVIAHENDASENLLAMTHRYWDNYPFKPLYTTKHLATNHIKWLETNSQIRVATAGSKAPGRSATIHFLHASEYAWWPDPKTVMLGLRQTIPSQPNTFVIIESTANGQGNEFHKEWRLAEAGDSEYTPLFFPWYDDPTYRASNIGIPYHTLGRLSDEETALRNMGISDDQLAWRRWAIRNLAGNDHILFMQEYPANPEEAFIATGMNVFRSFQLRQHYEPMEGSVGKLVRDGSRAVFIKDPNGPLKIFRTPSRDLDHGVYFIGADPSRKRSVIADFACAQVINRRTLEQVAVWRGKTDPATFAEELFKLGVYYNDAIIAPEKEGPGNLTVGKLLGMEYPNVFQHTKIDRVKGKVADDIYGWSTNSQTKHIAVGMLVKAVNDDRTGDYGLVIHDKTTYGEMGDFVTLPGNTYGPASEDDHDDTVMALAIAVTCNNLEAPPRPYGEASLPELPEVQSEPAGFGMVQSDETFWDTWGEEEREGA